MYQSTYPQIEMFARILFVIDPTFRNIIIEGYAANPGRLIQTVKNVRDHYNDHARTFFMNKYERDFNLLETKVCVEYLWSEMPRFDNYNKDKAEYLKSKVQANFDAFTGDPWRNNEYSEEPPF